MQKENSDKRCELTLSRFFTTVNKLNEKESERRRSENDSRLQQMEKRKPGSIKRVLHQN